MIHALGVVCISIFGIMIVVAFIALPFIAKIFYDRLQSRDNNPFE